MSIMKWIAALLVVVSCSCGFTRDLRIIASTVGPDRHADGTMARAGEYYALVWTANGSTFTGFAETGHLVDTNASKIVMAAPLCRVDKAGNAKCSRTLFIISEKLMPEYENGTFTLVLLETEVDAQPSGSSKFELGMSIGGYACASSTKVPAIENLVASASLLKLTAEVPLNELKPTVVPEPTIPDVLTDEEIASKEIESHLDESAVVRRVALDSKKNVVFTIYGTDKSRWYGIAVGSVPGMFDGVANAEHLVRGRGAKRNMTVKIPLASGQNYYRVVSYSDEEVEEK